MSISDRDVLLNEIYENPDDITAKLKYVDWVQEWSESQEERDRAELIQIEARQKDIDRKCTACNGQSYIFNTYGGKVGCISCRDTGERSNQLILNNPQWYQITCPKCNGAGFIKEKPKYASDITQPTLNTLCPVCKGSMDLMKTLRRSIQIHDSVTYDEMINKLEWHMGFIRSIEFENPIDIYSIRSGTFVNGETQVSKRLCYIMKEIPSISRIKIQNVGEPDKKDIMAMHWHGAIFGKELKPKGILQKWTWEQNRFPLGVIMELIFHFNDNRFETPDQAYEGLWYALCEYVKKWMKANPKWEIQKD